MNIINYNDRIEFLDAGKIIASFPKNIYSILIDNNDPYHFEVKSGIASIFDFYYNDISSPSTANPEALMSVLQGYFFTSNTNYSGSVDANNSSSAPLSSSATFTGETTDVSTYTSFVVACFSNVAGTLFVEFSTDGTNWDGSLQFNVSASLNEVHRLTVTRRYVRVRYVNGSVAQTTFRLQAIKGFQQTITSSLGSLIQRDADAILTRGIDFEASVAQGLFQGVSIILKSGRNPAIASNSVPEDIWNGSAVYSGFPTTEAEEFQVLSSSASDTGTYTFSYLASATSNTYQTATVTLNGTTPVNTGITGIRSHTANYNAGSSTGFNAGTITLRWRTTTSVIFHQMPIGTSQTYAAVYTVPAQSNAFIKRVFCEIHDSQSVSAQGALWIRTLNGSPRLRRNFAVQTGSSFQEDVVGGLRIDPLTDITMRITAITATTVVVGGFDVILVTV